MAIVLDTCTWRWHCSDPARLSERAREAVKRERVRSGLVVSVFSCWEIAKLVEKGKVRLSTSCSEWIDTAVRIEGLSLHPLTPEICIASTQLPGVFHGDPADQIIVATARLLGAAVVTPDRKIRDYPHVATLW